MIMTRVRRSTRRKPCPNTTLSTTNNKETDLASNLGLRGERPATHRLSHGLASLKTKTSLKYT